MCVAFFAKFEWTQSAVKLQPFTIVNHNQRSLWKFVQSRPTRVNSKATLVLFRTELRVVDG